MAIDATILDLVTYTKLLLVAAALLVAAILGATLVFIFGFITSYYYAWLMLFCLWSTWRQLTGRSLVVLALLFLSASSGLLTELTRATPLGIYAETSRLLTVAFALAFATQERTVDD